MTKKPRFAPTLTPPGVHWDAGYASNGIIDPSHWADELFGASIPGPWLTCYMLRRFGWPNAGSDPYKNLCSWMLTTPIEGLYLLVTPYLGHDGRDPMPLGKWSCGNLHFAVRFTKEVGEELERDPEREKAWAEREKAIVKWWEREGKNLYVFGTGDDGDGDGEEDELVLKGSEENGKVWGLWKRPDRMKKPQPFPRPPKHAKAMFYWWMGDFLEKAHPKALPRRKRSSERKPTVFQRRARRAIEAVLRDLLRPTYVRDINFSPFGDVERTPAAKERQRRQATVEPFEGAGHTPSYWFSSKRKRDERGAA